MLWLYVQAPFAAFRPFTAGWYRPTAGFLSPSAAYGLVLNIAGIESRRDDGLSPMTVTQFGLPAARIVLGAVPRPGADPFPSIQSLYQQLHNYPVGASGKERKEDAKGNKYNITPVRRQLLVDVRACIGLDAGPELEQRVRDGMRGAHPRYGLPFLGDNAFLIDRLEPLDNPPPAHWFRRIVEHDEDGIAPRTTRLTIWIDRQDMSKTLSALYAPDPEPTPAVPGKDYWTSINPPSAPPAPAKKAKAK